ncbi:hypothetical protein UlMin_041295 [Ulmus minor]
MGNCCLRKQLQEPNQPVGFAQPSTGRDNRVRRKGHVKSPTAVGTGSNLKKDEIMSSHAYKPHCFFYSDLKSATNKFSQKNFIGEGGFGDVYKGYVSFCSMIPTKPYEGFTVAVKRLRCWRPEGCREWENEVTFLGKLNHPNIVRLIGFCCEEEHRILVYEYMTRGSLETCLLKDDQKELNWRRRINIAIGAARGIAYIHSHGKSIIHRDIKASNFLLDSNFNPKLSDFGLAKHGPDNDDDHVSTRVLGTKGYFAPEYIGTGHLTVKVDVYSFGVVLLEILCGSSAVKKCSYRMVGDFVQKAKSCLSSKTELHRFIDERLGNNVPTEEARKFAKITNQCLSMDPKSRPTMPEVVAGLEQLEHSNSQISLGYTSFSACPPPSAIKYPRSNGCKIKR